jgi:hypothetical protein
MDMAANLWLHTTSGDKLQCTFGFVAALVAVIQAPLSG